MLAAMATLALVAHTGSATASAGSITFFSVAATVIPVLLLAVTIQGRTYQQLRKLKIRAATAWLITSSLIFLGLAGEITALVVLYIGIPDAAAALVVLSITILLAGAIVVAGLLTYLVVYETPEASAGKHREDEPEDLDARPAAEKPGTVPGLPGPS
jgi:hypothetical protein